jgi:DNA modification methylase
MTGSARIVRANARNLPLADNSVDLVVTSPPYFALRSYQDGGEHYAGQIGDEPTPTEFVASLLEVTRECVRVLKPSGSLWVNLGDKYVADNRGSGFDVKRGDAKHAPRGPLGYITGGMRQKSLMGIPWRYALACIDDLGLILRAEVIWSKVNGLPESVTDRVRRSHEVWFHFTLQPRYFSAVDEIREEYSERVVDRQRYAGRDDVPLSKDRGDRNDGNPARGILGHGHRGLSPLGKLPGSVWTVPTQPLRVPESLGVDHFAAFPMAFPRRIIQGWSPSGVCTGCGEGRRPVVDKRYLSTSTGYETAGRWGLKGQPEDTPLPTRLGDGVSATITGYSCACPEPTAPTTPAVVLDPFGGTGTTALVAKALGRHGISVDMSADYNRLATWRTNDPDQLAQAMQVDKPAKQVDGQADLFDLIEGEAS